MPNLKLAQTPSKAVALNLAAQVLHQKSVKLNDRIKSRETQLQGLVDTNSSTAQEVKLLSDEMTILNDFQDKASTLFDSAGNEELDCFNNELARFEASLFEHSDADKQAIAIQGPHNLVSSGLSNTEGTFEEKLHALANEANLGQSLMKHGTKLIKKEVKALEKTAADAKNLKRDVKVAISRILDKAASKGQSLVRGLSARKKIAVVKKIADQKKAALVIQSARRSFVARSKASLLRTNKLKSSAAVVIQAARRGQVDRLKATQLKKSQLGKGVSATTINAFARRVLVDRTNTKGLLAKKLDDLNQTTQAVMGQLDRSFAFFNEAMPAQSQENFVQVDLAAFVKKDVLEQGGASFIFSGVDRLSGYKLALATIDSVKPNIEKAVDESFEIAKNATVKELKDTINQLTGTIDEADAYNETNESVCETSVMTIDTDGYSSADDSEGVDAAGEPDMGGILENYKQNLSIIEPLKLSDFSKEAGDTETKED